MPRRRTGRKSTGGKAPRKFLAPKAPEANNSYYVSPPTFSSKGLEESVNDFCNASNNIANNLKDHHDTNINFLKFLIAVAKGKAKILNGLNTSKAEVIESMRKEVSEIKTENNIYGLKLHEFLQNFDAASSFGNLDELFKKMDTIIDFESKSFVESCSKMGSFEELMTSGTKSWYDCGRDRDQALQNWFHLSKLKTIGLTSWLDTNQELITTAQNVENQNGIFSLESFKKKSSKSTVEVFKSQASLNSSINDLADCNLNLHAEVIDVAEKMIEEIDNYKVNLNIERLKIRKLLYRSRKELIEPKKIFGKRIEAACILEILRKYIKSKKDLKAAFKKAKSAYNDAKVDSDDSDYEEGVEDLELKKLKEKKEAKERSYFDLLRKKDMLLVRLRTVCEQNDNFEAVNPEKEILSTFYFPEILIDGINFFAKKRKGQSDAQKQVLFLLQRYGLLAEDRSYKDYDLTITNNMPDLLHKGKVISSKTNIKGGFLKGSSTEKKGWKVLKEKAVSEFWEIYRAVVHANRIKHRGIVAVECAFVNGTNVVLQSQFYAGGDMRHWCKKKSQKSKLIAFFRIAEALSFLHNKGIVHRDIKPENIVFDSQTEAGFPALCDFDISKDTNVTNVTTMGYVGTSLYMPPEKNTRFERDVYSLGIAMIDVLCYNGNLNEIPTKSTGPMGVTIDLDQALIKVKQLQHEGEGMQSVINVIKQMTDVDPKIRPTSKEIVSKLGECIKLFDLRECGICMVEYQQKKMLLCETCNSFCCTTCFEMHVSNEVREMTEEKLHSLGCFNKGNGCKAIFSNQIVASNVSPNLFEEYFKKSEEFIEKKLETENERKMEEMKRDLLEKSREELAFLVKRQEIEDTTYLKCPKCRRVFIDYNGCAALQCSGRGGCGAHFCALCQVDCGTDAHAHVRECSLNPKPGDPFVSEEDFKNITDEQKRRKLLHAWNNLSEKEKRKLSADKIVRGIFKDLNVEIPGERMHQYAGELVELRIITNGNYDDEEMLQALYMTKGNVQEALDLYLL